MMVLTNVVTPMDVAPPMQLEILKVEDTVTVSGEDMLMPVILLPLASSLLILEMTNIVPVDLLYKTMETLNTVVIVTVVATKTEP